VLYKRRGDDDENDLCPLEGAIAMQPLMQNTAEWEEVRKDKIGASDAPIIMGVSPWKTPYGLWQKKLGLAAADQETFAQAEGKRKEPLARAALEQETGLLFAPSVRFHPTITWMMASLDAVDIENNFIAEIKCPGFEDHSAALQGKVPDKYFPQLQHQIEVAGVEFSYYFSFNGKQGALLKVYRDDDYIEKLVSKEKEFWECLQELQPPPLAERDYQKMESSEWLDLSCEWKNVHHQLKALEQKEEKLRKQLISLSGHRNAEGNGIKVTRSLRKGAIDYATIPQLQEIDLEQYRKRPVEIWKVISL
jgi:putative phage-type endonuclease